MKDPSQSKEPNFLHIDPFLVFNRRQIGIAKPATTQGGRLSQKIHLQVDFSAMAPPMTGPMTDPIAHCNDMIDIHLPRSRRVTISAMITYVRDTRPPPPIPWTHLPTRRIAMLCATEAMTVPVEKIDSAVRRTFFRPRKCEKEAHDGWKTVEHTRKLVPHQNASTAVVPRMLVAMV